MVINSNKFNFQDVIGKYLKTYQGETIEALTTIVPQVAKESVKKLKAASPKSDGLHSGTYAKGWRYKVEKGRIRVGATVCGGDPTYRLAHLLEYGHAKRGGGRVDGIEHILPVEEWAVDEASNRFIDYMERHINYDL